MVFLKRLFKRLEGNRLSFWGAGIILSLASIGLIVSCQAAGDASIAVTDVAIDNTETIVVMGSTLQLSATVSPANATNKGVTWSSNDENLATVDENGLISPKNFGGPVTITVKSVADNSKSDSIVISVKKSLTSVSYSETSIVTTVGTAITSLTSTVLPAGATGQYSVNPALPEGLSLVPGTGEIRGTPGTAVASAQYTVTFTGNGDYTGTVTANITIEVMKKSLTSVSYSETSIVTTVGTAITSLTSTVLPAGATGQYSVNPALPEGLSLVPGTGEISGTPGAAVASTQYTVTFTGNGDYTGTVTANITIEVMKKSLTSVSYSETSIVTTVGTAITSLTSTVLPAGATGQYSVNPALPEGLSLVPGTGEIRGTPGTAVASTQYTVTFTGNGDYTGTVTANITIEVMKKSLTSVSYSETSIVTTVGTAITSLTSTVLPAGATGQYSVNPALPEGLSLEPSTGEISGTPGTAVASAQYTVTFTGNGDYTGTVTANITIEVQYTVGDTGPAGGIVFYVKDSESDGWRYLEAAKSDQATSVEWGGYGISVGGTSTGIGSGKANTEAIVQTLGDGNYTRHGSDVELNGNYAAKICDDLELGGHDDWFLPSKNELNELYKQRNIVGGFASSHYWSSSEDGFYGAWLQYFANGGQNGNAKDNDVRVRAVRAF